MIEPPAVLFHATRVSSRASIQRHGIDYTKDRTKPKAFRTQRARRPRVIPDGNYLYEDVWSAVNFADRFIATPFEVWAVDASNLNLELDPEPVGEAWLCTAVIPTGNLLGIAWSHDYDLPDELAWEVTEQTVDMGV